MLSAVSAFPPNPSMASTMSSASSGVSSTTNQRDIGNTLDTIT